MAIHLNEISQNKSEISNQRCNDKILHRGDLKLMKSFYTVFRFQVQACFYPDSLGFLTILFADV